MCNNSFLFGFCLSKSSSFDSQATYHSSKSTKLLEYFNELHLNQESYLTTFGKPITTRAAWPSDTTPETMCWLLLESKKRLNCGHPSHISDDAVFFFIIILVH